MVDKSTILQIFGALMKHPQYLSESDKYNLTPQDFYYRLDKYIFMAIENLYRNGAERIQPIDVENYLNTNDINNSFKLCILVYLLNKALKSIVKFVGKLRV